MEYEDWEIPDPYDDFESQYSEELEMMNEMAVDKPVPLTAKKLSSKRVLDFGPEENDENSDKKPHTASKLSNGTGTYQAIPVDEDSDEELRDDITGLSPHRKRQKLDDGSKGLRVDTAPLPTSSQSVPSSLLPRQRATGLSNRPIFGKNCLTVTGTNGDRVYISIAEDKLSTQSEKSVKKNMTPGSMQLLSQPFEELREQVEDERRRQFLQVSENITNSLRELTEDVESLTEVVDEAIENETEDGALNQHGALWVEKYAPKHYTELLSDDFVNRTLLAWLKLWDGIVFGKKVENKAKKPATDGQPKQKNPKDFQEKPDWEELDSTNRPIYKVALLCGPPGLGKTTLAHVIARHAGYNVVEMNASDDRSAEIFQQRIEAATQMKSVIDPDRRPNCLVIDEIDGAPTAAINILLNIIKKKESAPTQKKKSKKVPQLLSKPIICICNDLYTPALRPLRQVAFVIAFPPTLPSRLASRLLHIARSQKLKTDMTALLALCEKAENDVRSCLNTLQFVNSRGTGELHLNTVQSMDIGQKDAHKSLFTVWKEIFTLPQPKKQRFNALAAASGSASVAVGPLRDTTARPTAQTASASRFHRILHTTGSNSEFEKLSQGIFENYLNVRFKDPNLDKVTAGTEWLEFTDFVQEKVMHYQTFILQRFLPFLAVSFHMLFACPTSTKLRYPNTQFETSQKLAFTKSTLLSMAGEVSPRIRHNLDTKIAVLDLLPSLLHVMTPTLRPVNTTLYSNKEKQQLEELINTMIAYNITYHQERNQDGQYTYVLDPNIEELIKFTGLPQHKQLTYAAKQLIAREIDLEKMRRAENMRKDKEKSQPQDAKAVKKPAPEVVLKMKPKPKEEKPALDFFGRVIQPKTATSEKGDKNLATRVMPGTLWFRFNEGFSNAVRTSVKMKDLF